MKNVRVFLADGFEEIEALTVVDILRRAGVETTTVSVTKKCVVEGAHGICVEADALFEETDFHETEMLVLPGGMPGTLNLQAHTGLRELLLAYGKAEKYVPRSARLRVFWENSECWMGNVPAVIRLLKRN